MKRLLLNLSKSIIFKVHGTEQFRMYEKGNLVKLSRASLAGRNKWLSTPKQSYN